MPKHRELSLQGVSGEFCYILGQEGFVPAAIVVLSVPLYCASQMWAGDNTASNSLEYKSEL